MAICEEPGAVAVSTVWERVNLLNAAKPTLTHHSSDVGSTDGHCIYAGSQRHPQNDQYGDRGRAPERLR